MGSGGKSPTGGAGATAAGSTTLGDPARGFADITFYGCNSGLMVGEANNHSVRFETEPELQPVFQFSSFPACAAWVRAAGIRCFRHVFRRIESAPSFQSLPPPTSDLYAVFGTFWPAPGLLYSDYTMAVGAGGTIVHLDTNSLMTSPSTKTLMAIHGIVAATSRR